MKKKKAATKTTTKTTTVSTTIHLKWIASVPSEYVSFFDPEDSKEKALQRFVELLRKIHAERVYREVNSGAVWEDEPGIYAADLNTTNGPVKLRGASLESGQLEDSRPEVAESATMVGVEKPPTSSELWDQLLSSATPVGEKSEALAQLIADDAPGVPAFLVSELKKDSIASDWLEKLLFASEQVQFNDPDMRGTLKDLLYANATLLHKTGKLRSEQALWAAIRRYASLVEEEGDVQALQPFLEGKTSIATRQVALQAVHASFQQAPPKDSSKIGKLSDRIKELAEKYVDADLLVSPDNTSLAFNAALALSALGSSDSRRVAERMKETGNRWLLRRTTQCLEEMLATWSSSGRTGKRYEAAIKNLTDSLSKLTEVL